MIKGLLSTMVCCSICDGLYVKDLFQFDRPGIGATLMYCTIEGILLLLLVIAIEVFAYRTLCRWLWQISESEKGGSAVATPCVLACAGCDLHMTATWKRGLCGTLGTYPDPPLIDTIFLHTCSTLMVGHY